MHGIKSTSGLFAILYPAKYWIWKPDIQSTKDRLSGQIYSWFFLSTGQKLPTEPGNGKRFFEKLLFEREEQKMI